ncbi:ferredoxin reductase family protein [Kineosporia sp. NBRC 101731]|uniref:ferredoxin reductase family protein n=1 Tax=Kineosporia sp. NBRC 101731 TaxID=3032199 RepID=UPI0024A41A73|nr:ferredoxin reductase family protein [Kineosporia sp. NBRC 101731]GLY33823.1 ferric reductase [Kineosporia sp. NBRC 101731]
MTAISPPHQHTAPFPPAPGRARITPVAALTLIALGAAPVLGLWWQDTTFVSGTGGLLTNAGRITGLAAGYAVLVVLALMARVPALERGVGADRLARWHAAGGRYVVSLAVVHTLLIVAGYTVEGHTGLLAQVRALLTSFDMLMATAALGLFLLVGVTSARAARRRLAYETWHLVHLLTYLAIALTFTHQFSAGADFTDRRVQVVWLALYAVVGTLLLWYRLLTPLLNLTRHTLRVESVVPHGTDTVSVTVRGRNLARLDARPGQFFRWRFLTPGLWAAANPYSLSAPPAGDRLRITVKTAGTHSAALAHLRPGTRVLAEGPYGSFTGDLDRRSSRGRASGKVLLIGIGIGITPLRALFETIPAAPGGLTLLYRARDTSDLVLWQEIQQIAAARGARLEYLVGDRRSTDHLSRRQLRYLLPDLREHEVYLCGPDELVGRVIHNLRREGVPRAAVHHESFTF